MSERQPPLPKVVPDKDPPLDPVDTEEQEAEQSGVPEVSMEEVLENIATSKDAPEASEPIKRKSSQGRRRRGAKTSIGDADSFRETPREAREALEDVVGQFEDTSAQSRAEAERAAVLEAESAYLGAYKQLEEKKTIWNRLAKGKNLKEESEKVQALKRVYDEKRVVYAEALTEFARQRLEDVDNKEDLDVEKVDRTIERYNRIVRFREVVKPAAEKRLAARKEALDSRGRNVFEKALGWSARQNQLLEKRIGKSGAIAVRSLAGAIGVSGLAALAGGFGAAALTGAGVYGVHKFARGFIGAYAGKLGGDLAGSFYEQRFGRQAQGAAKESLKTAGRNTDISVETLQSLDALREKLTSKADEATLQRKKALVQALAAFGIGAGAAAALSDVLAIQRAADTVVESVSVDVADTPAASLQESVAPVVPSVAEVTSEAPTPNVVAPESVLAEAVVGKGEGFNQLFVDLRASELSGDSPVVRHLLDSNMSASELSEEVKALIGEKNAVTLEGDKLFVNGDGNLVFERDGVQQVLMENTGDVYDVHPLENVALKEIHVPVAEPVSAIAIPDAPEAVAPEVTPPSTDASIGRSLSEFGSVTDIEDAAPPVESTATVGRSLEDFTPHQDTVPSTGAEQVPEHPTGTIGRPLEDFQTMRDIEVQNVETFTNMHGVEVNPAEPAAYTWNVPGTDTTITVSSGGTPEQQSAYARSYADTHPGSTVHFITPVLEDGIVKYRMDVWDSVEGTPAQRYTDIAPRTGTYPPIEPEAFTQKLP